MSVLFWLSALCLFVFVIGFCVYVWMDIQRLKKGDRMTAFGKPESARSAPEASLRDPVTGLYNRKHLLNRLQENIARCTRTGERMAVILWDIDGFIDFNNQFGQNEGDRLLKRVAETIRRCVRAYDESFRSGPDEFCSLLVPADEAMAGEVTQRVGQTISRYLFEPGTEYAGRRFSITSGLVYYPGPDKLPESILHAAGQALYRARHSNVGAL